MSPGVSLEHLKSLFYFKCGCYYSFSSCYKMN